jgi:predicted amidohydrolase
MTPTGPEKSTVIVAAAQYPLDRLATIEDYGAKLRAWVREAVRHGAELVVFPEYGAMETCALDARSLESPERSLEVAAGYLPTLINQLSMLAQEFGVHILSPSGPERGAQGQLNNVAYLLAPNGKVGRQAKVLMTPGEAGYGVKGYDATTNMPALDVFETTLGRIGVAICYDCEFPLLVRSLVEKGADIVLIPSCTEFVSGSNRIKTGALARALENGIATVVSQTIGAAPFTPVADLSTGLAAVYIPAEHGLSDTGVLAEGERDQAGFVYAEIDLAHLRRIRLEGEMRNNLDWAKQPGAASVASHAGRVDLR